MLELDLKTCTQKKIHFHWGRLQSGTHNGALPECRTAVWNRTAVYAKFFVTQVTTLVVFEYQALLFYIV